MSILLGLNTAVRALLSQQLALNTTSHNIANANTPGYSRQDVRLETTDPFTVPSQNRASLAGQIGTGVTVREVRRIRDEFLDKQFRQQNEALAYWQTVSGEIANIEDIFNEPSDNGFGKVLSQFWNRWRDLTNDPSNPAMRLTLREQASDLATFIRGTYQRMNDERRHLDEQVVTDVAAINSFAQQINSLNEQIRKVIGIGDSPNDLKDRRDLILDQLSKIVRISAIETQSGAISVSIGGGQLVGEGFLNSINTPVVAGYHNLTWNDTGLAVTVLGGEMKGLLDQRDTTIPNTQTSLNSLATTLIAQVNTQHRLGFALDGTTTNDFFSGTVGQEAATIDVTAAIKADVSKIAAAGVTGAPGDSDNANLIAALQFKLAMTGNTVTMDDFYRGVISTLGSTGQQAQRQADNQMLLTQHVEQARQSISGVSLDEEATAMIKYQRAYEGAARMVTTIDQMLDTIINRMGIVGR